VTELEVFAALRSATRIEGALNVFRSPGFLTLHGMETWRWSRVTCSSLSSRI
jgi:hypothetical protein